jgi:hypothetical protein
MSQILLNLALQMLQTVVRHLIDTGLFDHILALVEVYFNASLSGDQKKAAVQADLAQLQGDLKVAFSGTPTVLINLAIEAAVAIIKNKKSALIPSINAAATTAVASTSTEPTIIKPLGQ